MTITQLDYAVAAAPDYKEGDFVICVKAPNSSSILKENQIYLVDRIEKSDAHSVEHNVFSVSVIDLLSLDVLRDVYGMVLWHFAYRFKLHK